jgi:ribosomal protein S18 acetylase RimI-like enzyme
MATLSELGISINKTSDSTDLTWCAQLMAGNEPWLTLKRDLDKCQCLLQDPLSEVYLLTDGTERVGFVMIKMKGAFCGYLQTIAIDTPYRRKGIGEAAIGYIEAIIFTTYSNVFMCVSSFNHRAQELYQRLGYETVGIFKDLVEKGHDEILLRKTIGPMNAFRKNK